jgi:hypothetical protein
MVNFENDYLYGIQKQKEILPILRDYFGKDLEETVGRWKKYDFYSDKSIFELKSRKNTKTRYQTSLLTCNKVVSESGKDLIFLFNFTDQLCYIKYDPDLFSTFERRLFSRINESFDEKDYFYIPIERLTMIKKYECLI